MDFIKTLNKIRESKTGEEVIALYKRFVREHGKPDQNSESDTIANAANEQLMIIGDAPTTTDEGAKK